MGEGEMKNKERNRSERKIRIKERKIRGCKKTKERERQKG
jgi:hypothetical protein